MLALPLHCYDEAGRIKPPKWLFWILALGLKDWVLLVFALASREHTDTLMRLFYPDPVLFEINLGLALPFVVLFFTFGFRQKLWDRGWIRWAVLIKPTMVLALLAQVLFNLSAVVQSGGVFNLSSGLLVFLSATCLLVVLRSQHVKFMLNDWVQP